MKMMVYLQRLGLIFNLFFKDNQDLNIFLRKEDDSLFAKAFFLIYIGGMMRMMVYLQRLGCCEECAGGNKPGKVNLKSKYKIHTIHNTNTHNTQYEIHTILLVNYIF